MSSDGALEVNEAQNIRHSRHDDAALILSQMMFGHVIWRKVRGQEREREYPLDAFT